MPPSIPPRRPTRPSALRGRRFPGAGWWSRLNVGQRARAKVVLAVAGALCGVLFILVAILWVHDARIIEAKLGGEQRPMPRIYGRPFELRPGQGLTPVQLEQRLNDVGYAQRTKAEQPGEFSSAGG